MKMIPALLLLVLLTGCSTRTIYLGGTSVAGNGTVGPQGPPGPAGTDGTDGTDGVDGVNGTNGINGTGISTIYVLTNGSLQINLTNGTNITSGNLTGAAGPQGPAGEGGSGTRWVNVTSVSNQNVSGTTLANITGLLWQALPYTNYTFSCNIKYRTNVTTTGISFALDDWGGVVSWFRMSVNVYSVSATTLNSGEVNVTGTKVTSTGVTAANTPYSATLEGLVYNGNSTVTITPQFSSEAAGLNSAILQGSYCEVSTV